MAREINPNAQLTRDCKTDLNCMLNTNRYANQMERITVNFDKIVKEHATNNKDFARFFGETLYHLQQAEMGLKVLSELSEH